MRAVVRSRHRNRGVLAVRTAKVAAVAAVRKNVSSRAETHQRLLFDRIQSQGSCLSVIDRNNLPADIGSCSAEADLTFSQLTELRTNVTKNLFAVHIRNVLRL